MKAYLPQNDPEPQKRQDWLQRNRRDYEFDLNYLPPLSMIKQVPAAEAFSAKYLSERLLATSNLATNTLAVQLQSMWDPLDELQDYEDFFPVLPRPKIIKNYQTDDSFCEQRLCGVNPMVIRNVKQMPPNLLEKVQSKFGKSLNLQQELERGNLYVTDYTRLGFVQGGTYERGKSYVPTPVAYFCWQSAGYSDRGELVPIAIQFNLENGQTSSIVTPFDNSLTWFKAKLCVQIADGNHHEMSSHLCRTHLVMEPFAIVTARQLAFNHPVGLLLRPHFRFMIANNDLARKRLINRGGYVDELLGGTLQESLQIVKNSYQEWSFDQFAFPNDLQNRGMDDKARLPHYPYRDDGMLVWNAIKKFVGNYLRIYYKTPQDISGDKELQAWAQELVSPQGGRVKGMRDRIENLDQLINIITNIIFTCSAQHSAVNYPQYEYMGFVPNMPLAAYQPITEDLSIPDPKSLMSFLPPPKQAADQLTILYVLSAYRYDRLGYYEDYSFADPAAVAAIEQFKQELSNVEREIQVNNKSRLVEYIYLRPSLIINSISV